MKNLNEYIKEGLFDNIGVGIEHQIEEWIKENTSNQNISIIEKDNKYIVNADNIFFKKAITSLTNGMFEWGEIYDIFNCSDTPIKSLEGAPKKCRSFNCHYCYNLTSLKGLENSSINSLNCKFCSKLTSLKDFPKDCDILNCSDTPIKSLEGISKKFYTLDCTSCKKLTSLKYAPQECENFICNSCYELKDLKGAPKKCKMFCCNDCIKLTSIKDAPYNLQEFYCRNCKKEFSNDEKNEHLK